MPSPLSAIRLLRPAPPTAAPALLVELPTLDGLAPLGAARRRPWVRLAVVGVVLAAVALLALPGVGRGDDGAAGARPRDRSAVAEGVAPVVSAGLAARDAKVGAPFTMASLTPEVRQAVATAIVAQVARAQAAPSPVG